MARVAVAAAVHQAALWRQRRVLQTPFEAWEVVGLELAKKPRRTPSAYVAWSGLVLGPAVGSRTE
jgi:hypothetical protein